MARNRTEKDKRLRSELEERMVGYVTAALGLVASLAWNEAIKELIAVLYPASHDTLVAKFLYASILTIMVTLISVMLLRVRQR